MKSLIKLTMVAVLAAFITSSCSVQRYSSRQNYVNNAVVAAMVADLNVSSEKVVYTVERPNKEIQSLGFNNVLNAAIAEAVQSVNADVLVGTQYVCKQKASGKVKVITVSGYPALYTNFRPVPDDAIADIIVSANVNNVVSLKVKKK